MYLSSLLKLINGSVEKIYDDIYIKNYTLNSKKMSDVFICISNGHKYVNDAIKNGVKVIIYSEDIEIDDSAIYIKVEDTIKSLEQIANYKRSNSHALVIAITGSVGKTTTKELVSLILESKYKVLKNIGNKNNIIGISETLLELTDDIDFLVLEIGMNHAGEISKLSKLVKPDIGIITNIGSAHIGNLGSKKNIFKAKMEILDGNPNMILIVNGEDIYLKKLKCLKCYNDTYNYSSEFSFMNMNYLLAIYVAIILGFNYNNIVNILNKYKMYKQRMNIIKLNNKIIIDDTYNASLESIIGGLMYLTTFFEYKIIVLGDILELGKYSKKYHKKINKYLNAITNKEVLLLGNHTKYIKGKHFKTHADLISYLDSIDIKNSVIYLKGSRMMHLEIIKDNLVAKN